ncbi:MAG: M13 family peptidase [Sphingomonadales bacterium]|nr:MAG: M13 family peptidase [Sphingomonadales bacterium]
MRFSLLATTFLAAPVLLAGCTQTQPAPPVTEVQPITDPAPAQAGPKPTYGDFGFDETGMNRAVAPGDDFYEYANGTWAKNTPVPSDKSNYGAFNVLADKAQEDTRGIIEEAAKDPNSKIGIAYNAYLDTAAIEAKGLAPIQPWLGQIKGLKSKAGYAALVASAKRNGVRAPFSTYVGQDDKNPDVYALNLNQSGLGMPDRDYYLSTDAKLTEAKVAYEKHLTNVLRLADEPNAAARAKAIVDFETGIARIHWTQTESRDADKTYNKMTLAELAKLAPGFDFPTYFKGIGVKTQLPYVLVSQPSAVAGIAKAIQTTPLDVLKDQLLVRSIDDFAGVLPAAFDKEQFAFYSTTLTGTPEQQLRWKRSVDYTTGILADEIGKIYVEKYFPPETKKAADEMVTNIIAAMGRRIDSLDWMTPETKKKAREKLAAFTPRMGYPDQWRDYSSMQIVAGDALGNALRANNWRNDDSISKLGGPIRRWEWGMTPMTVNAQANPGLVAITFPAAILQPPFFDPNADPAINYGGMGAVIGHEISHHFDDQGAKYDMHGRLTDWWTPADVAAFKVRTDQLVAQYDKYEPLPGKFVNGRLTLGENTADLAGLTAAYDAYKHLLGDKAAPVINGTTGDQRFYLGWAQVWRRNYREAALRQRLLTDSHSPSIERTWVVRNLDPWYGAYTPAPTAKMALSPEKRVRIW